MIISLLWLQVAVGAALIFISSRFLVQSSDVIALRTGLGRTFIGIILLATATSLPELGIGISSITLVGEPDLAAGDAFGSNLFNLLIIGILEIFWANNSILKTIDRRYAFIALTGLVAILIASVAVLFHSYSTNLSNWYLSPFTIVLILLFANGIYNSYRNKAEIEDKPFNTDGADTPFYHQSLLKAIVICLIVVPIMIASAIWMAVVADQVATQMGWHTSYVGTQFLALITSLPELSTSIVAMKIKAPALAISNILGSNLFNMGFILFVDDLAYTQGSFWSSVNQIHTVTGVFAILMTTIILLPLLKKDYHRLSNRWPIEGFMIIGLYIVASLVAFKFTCLYGPSCS